jgi:enoyl-CoA hydratase
VPADQLLDEAVHIAATIAAMSRLAPYATKAAVNRAFETTLAEGIRFERQACVTRFASADRTEGMAAFLEKRAPNFGSAMTVPASSTNGVVG